MHAKQDRQLSAQAAAYLYARGLPQVEIARQLGLSQSGVSRMIEEAERRGWLVSSRVEFAKDRIGADRLKQIEARIQPPGLAELIWRSLPESQKTLASVHLFDSGSDDTDTVAFARRRRRLASLAAPHIAFPHLELLKCRIVRGHAAFRPRVDGAEGREP